MLCYVQGFENSRRESLTICTRPSSNGNARSVPVTPNDVEIEDKSSEAASDSIPYAHSSPNRSFSNTDSFHGCEKYDWKKLCSNIRILPHTYDIKQLSSSTPAMTQAHSVSRGPTDPDGSGGAPTIAKMTESSEVVQAQGLNKARQKKFNRHFQQVGSEERVLDYYSCALVGDILLQGRLYVTKNYFAFYSNVFGYVTKLLIPLADVMEVSKEKTAKIIPNAVGISTEDEKHVFGSLLSRDSTYKFMLEVWNAAKGSDPSAGSPAKKDIKNEIEDSASGDLLLEDDSTVSGSGNEDGSVPGSSIQSVMSTENLKSLIPKMKKKNTLRLSIPLTTTKEYWSAVKPSTILAVSTALLVSLYLSAGFLLYRIAAVQSHFSDYPITTPRNDVYRDILKWKSELHSRSASEVHEFLNANLNQIAKVRLSLEALSMLILSGSEKKSKNDGRKEFPEEEEEELRKMAERSKKGTIS